MHRRFVKKYVEKHVIDLTAILISITALFFAIWQGRAQIVHNHISVEPRITSYFASDAREQKFGIYIFNNGLGAAFVKSLTVFVDGKEVPDHKWGKFFSAAVKLDLNPMCFLFGGPRPHDSFSVGKSIYLIEAQPNPPINCSGDQLMLMQYQETRLNYKLVMESIYGDEFEYTYWGNNQKRL